MAGKAKAVTEPVVAKSVASEKQQAILIAMQQITKQFGAGSIMKLGEAHAHMAIEVIPTGSVGLDLALGAGGIPKGRISEIYGPEASGKTTLCLHVIAESQKRGGTAAFIDAEHALDPARAAGIGVNLDELLISQPDTGEQALEIAETLIRSGAVDVIVIDSVAALVPKAEIEGEMGDAMMGLQARLMSQALRKLTGAINKSNTVVIFTNQLREKIGVMFGNPETTTGGKALKFYASVRLDIRRKDQIKDAMGVVVGNHVKVKVVKNKVAPPFTEAEFDILYNEGVSYEASVLDFATDLEVVEKKGAWLTFAGEMLGQGREVARLFLKENPPVLAKIVAAIHAKRAAPAEAEAALAAEKAAAKK